MSYNRHLIPDLSNGNNFLNKYEVMVHFSAHGILMGKEERIRVVWGVVGTHTVVNANLVNQDI